MARESIRREIAFYLLAGAHTSATAFTRVMHNIFGWIDAHPDQADRVRTDRMFVQRATHETIRLQPSSPVAMRWALADIELGSGIAIAEGDKVIIDLISVNRDASVYGDDAEAFDPDRALDDGVTPWGLSFGQGMHACIGQDLAAGIVPAPDGDTAEHLFGLVPVAVQAMFDHGVRGRSRRGPRDGRLHQPPLLRPLPRRLRHLTPSPRRDLGHTPDCKDTAHGSATGRTNRTRHRRIERARSRHRPGPRRRGRPGRHLVALCRQAAERREPS